MGLTPHWPAVWRSKDGTLILSDVLYPDATSARNDLGNLFVKLATEYPALSLEARREFKALEPIKGKPAQTWQRDPRR